jgi:hypothetical protein
LPYAITTLCSAGRPGFPHQHLIQWKTNIFPLGITKTQSKPHTSHPTPATFPFRTSWEESCEGRETTQKFSILSATPRCLCSLWKQTHGHCNQSIEISSQNTLSGC